MADLTLDAANAIIAGALDHAAGAGLQPLSIVVLDAAGHVKAAVRQDGATMFRFDVALGKAWAAAAMGAPSRKLSEIAKGNPNFFVTLAATAQGKFLPQPGAVLIRDADGKILGAAGASGDTGDNDELACAAGVRAAGYATE